MSGVSGSGKSTISKKLKLEINAEIIETDEIRFELTGNASDQSQNWRVFGIAKHRIRDNLSVGKNVIFDATNLSIKDRRDFVDIGKEFDCEIHAYIVKPSLSVCKERNSLRDRKVPVEIIDKQYAKFVMPTENEGFYKIVTCVN